MSAFIASPAFLYCAGGLVLVVSILFFMLWNAPDGYENESGFHYGKEDK